MLKRMDKKCSQFNAISLSGPNTYTHIAVSTHLCIVDGFFQRQTERDKYFPMKEPASSRLVTDRIDL